MIASLHIVETYKWMSAFMSLYLILDSAEKLSIYREYSDEGVFSWKALQNIHFFSKRSKRVKQGLNFIFDNPRWTGILFLRSILSLLLLIVPFTSPLTPVILVLLVTFGLLVNLRNYSIGAETQNRVGLMILITIMLYTLFPTSIVGKVGLWFVSLQSCFSYFTAGYTKLLQKDWRKGNAILLILGYDSLIENKKLYSIFDRHKIYAIILCWITIIMECTFPIILIYGKPILYFYLIWGLLFHVLIAIVLRINLFVWVWLATYPALIFISQ